MIKLLPTYPHFLLVCIIIIIIIIIIYLFKVGSYRDFSNHSDIQMKNYITEIKNVQSDAN